jgi:GGDEF domain-containing protein
VKRCWRSWFVLAWVACVWPVFLKAAPQVSWSDQVKSASQQDRRSPISLDVKQVWHATRVGQVELSNEEFFDPDQVWNWPAERFGLMQTREAFFLRQGQRLVTRMTLFSDAVGTDLNLSAVLPRLDAMHVSYRYDNGPWTTLSAGDTLAMNRWLVPDRHPTFDIPQIKGQMDLVVQIAHRGNAFAPYLLQNDRASVASLTYNSWSVGMMAGIQLIMALISALLAINFRRAGFFSVTLMSLLTMTVLFFGSGLGALYVGTASNTFNDQIKFFSTTVWCLALPWVAATVLGLNQRSPGWFWCTSLWMVLGVLLTWFWADYHWRDTTAVGVPVMLVVTLAAMVGMVLWSGVRHLSLQPVILMGLLLYATALLMPFMGYLGVISNSASHLAAAGLMLLSSLLLINGLYARHRMGRQVMARANISPLRDVLTGLLNREGIQAHLFNKVRQRLRNDNMCAVFIYISVMDAEQAMREHGEQGFEMGMVQMAASLSTSVTGADGLGRVSRHAFGITVLMPPDPALAIRLAQKILSRLMALASHGAPLAGTARMALSWLPLNGFRIDNLERRSLRTLQELESVKKIGWVGGAQSHADAAQMLHDARQVDHSSFDGVEGGDTLHDAVRKDGASSNLYERIHRIEREMLHGVDTRFLVAEADRMSRAINEAHSSQGSTQSMDDHEPESPTDEQPTLRLQPELRGS